MRMSKAWPSGRMLLDIGLEPRLATLPAATQTALPSRPNCRSRMPSAFAICLWLEPVTLVARRINPGLAVNELEAVRPCCSWSEVSMRGSRRQRL